MADMPRPAQSSPLFRGGDLLPTLSEDGEEGAEDDVVVDRPSSTGSPYQTEVDLLGKPLKKASTKPVVKALDLSSLGVGGGLGSVGRPRSGSLGFPKQKLAPSLRSKPGSRSFEKFEQDQEDDNNRSVGGSSEFDKSYVTTDSDDDSFADEGLGLTHHLVNHFKEARRGGFGGEESLGGEFPEPESSPSEEHLVASIRRSLAVHKERTFALHEQHVTRPRRSSVSATSDRGPPASERGLERNSSFRSTDSRESRGSRGSRRRRRRSESTNSDNSHESRGRSHPGRRSKDGRPGTAEGPRPTSDSAIHKSRRRRSASNPPRSLALGSSVLKLNIPDEGFSAAPGITLLSPRVRETNVSDGQHAHSFRAALSRASTPDSSARGSRSGSGVMVTTAIPEDDSIASEDSPNLSESHPRQLMMHSHTSDCSERPKVSPSAPNLSASLLQFTRSPNGPPEVKSEVLSSLPGHKEVSKFYLDIRTIQGSQPIEIAADTPVQAVHAVLTKNLRADPGSNAAFWIGETRLKPDQTFVDAGLRPEETSMHKRARVTFGPLPEKVQEEMIYARAEVLRIASVLEESTGALVTTGAKLRADPTNTSAPHVYLLFDSDSSVLLEAMWGAFTDIPNFSVFHGSADPQQKTDAAAMILFGDVYGLPNFESPAWQRAHETYPLSVRKVQEAINSEYQGEAPLNTTIIVPATSAFENFTDSGNLDQNKFLVYVAASLGQQEKQPGTAAPTFYSLFRSIFCAINAHNANRGKSRIHAVSFEVEANLGFFWSLGDELNTQEMRYKSRVAESISKQMVVAALGWLWPQRMDTKSVARKANLLMMPAGDRSQHDKIEELSWTMNSIIPERGFVTEEQISLMMTVLVEVAKRGTEKTDSDKKPSKRKKLGTRKSKAVDMPSDEFTMAGAVPTAVRVITPVSDLYFDGKVEAAVKFVDAALRTLATRAWPKEKIPGLRRRIVERGLLPFVIVNVTEGWPMLINSLDPIPVYEELDYRQLTPMDEVGAALASGAAAEVYAAQYQNTSVAVKLSRFEPTGGLGADDYTMRECWRELALLSMLSHPNIIRIYGGHFPDPKKARSEVHQGSWNLNSPTIAMMKADGSLRQVLDDRPEALKAIDRLAIAAEQASALAYLHNLRIVHRDVKSMNILVRYSARRKIWHSMLCDFGSTRAVPPEETKLGNKTSKEVGTMTGGVGTCGWMAPELFSKHSYGLAVDAYAYGMVLYELMTDETPFEKHSSFQVPLMVAKGVRPDLPAKPKHMASTADTLRKVVQSLWDGKPQKRPPMKHVSQTLQKLLDDRMRDMRSLTGNLSPGSKGSKKK